MIFPILHTSDFARNFLQTDCSGTVHSVYRKTINIQINGQLMALQAIHSPLSPISLITGLSQEEMAFLGITAGMTVEVDPAHSLLRIYENASSIEPMAVFNFDGALTRNLGLSAHLTRENISNLAREIHQALLRTSTGGFSMLISNPEDALENLMLQAADRRMTAARAYYKDNQMMPACRELCGLIGLGTGLTPCGDDFLCGVLAGLILTGKEEETFSQALHTQIPEHLTDTNVISAAFLLCALNGQFSAAVNSLTSLPDAGKILNDFLAIGHSSGTDTLCGILWALSLAEED